MSLPATAEEVRQAFAACHGWEARTRLLLQWGDRLPPADASLCGDANRVHGCASAVWLRLEQQTNGPHFRLYSDARLLRGLLALLLVRIDGLDAIALAEVDVPGWFEQLGLGRQLNPSRSNGLHAVLLRMRELLE